jgi:multicomponent Na+:H+ antiporter subunit C
MELLGHFNYWIVVVLMMIGFYALIARGNLIKKIVGLNIFQASVFLLYISLGKVTGGSAPIIARSRACRAHPRELRHD